MRSAILCALLGLLFAGFGLSGARALPRFAAKEKKACAYCHVKPSGGMPLTAAGKYYDAHGTLVGYKPGAAARPAVPPKGLRPGALKPGSANPPKARERREREHEEEREHRGRGEREHERHEKDDD